MVSNEKDENYYLHLLEKFISDPDLIELEQNLKTFNFMRIFKISKSETATSAFLRWLLDPNEDHGIGDYFLRYFLMECANSTNEFNLIEIDGLQLEKAIVRTEENFWGKMPSSEPSAERYKHYVIKALSGDDNLSTFESEALASGLAGVWARENTRAALFEAMQKKEVYATTGTRIAVRFFGGWEYGADDIFQPDAVSIGYAKGVPMGGDLPTAPEGASAPVFMVGALKDAWSGNLDRIQIIKLWVDDEGKRQERIYDVAASDDRKIDSKGRITDPVASTVDEANASYLNTVGDAELRAVWTDPDFDPARPAVYYARVLEIPTPTWQAHDAKFFGVTMPKGVPLSHQERAYTSPIWYTPKG